MVKINSVLISEAPPDYSKIHIFKNLVSILKPCHPKKEKGERMHFNCNPKYPTHLYIYNLPKENNMTAKF